MQRRFLGAMEITAKLATTADDLCFYSPIVSWHEAAQRYELPKDFNWWRERDLFMIRRSDALWVIPFPDWESSFGVSQEIEFAHDIGRPVFYVLEANPKVVITEEKPTQPLTLPQLDNAVHGK